MADQTLTDQTKSKAVEDFIDRNKQETADIRRKWESNYRQFIEGSVFPDKEDWQSNFSLGKYNSAIRGAVGFTRQVMFNRPDWYVLDPVNPDNERAALLAPIIKKWVDFELDQAKFKRKASTFLINTFVAMGVLVVGWTTRLVRNPEWTDKKTKPERDRERNARADIVQNPKTEFESELQIQESVEDALADLGGIFDEDPVAARADEPKPWIEISGLDIQVVQPDLYYWDDNNFYMEDSAQAAYSTFVRPWELRQMADSGVLDKENVDAVVTTKIMDDATAHTRARRIRRGNQQRVQRDSVVELKTYFGPLILDDQAKNPAWGAVVASGKVLKEWDEYPYWEPPNHRMTPFVTAAVKEIPGRPTGQGAGDNVVENARQLDSNINLATDALRFNVAGITAVDYLNLADQSILESGGVAPFQIVETVGNPANVIRHIPLTNNIENQWSPMNQLLMESITEQIGVDEFTLGGPTRRSRVTATETQARGAGTQRNINNIAVDLETQFLVPVIQKCIARILQFGIPELESNVAVKQVLDPTEINVLQNLKPKDRLEILNSWYRVKVNGFSDEIDRNERVNDLNEVIAIANGQGPMSQLINLPALMQEWARAMNIRDPEKILFTDSELGEIERENQLLIKDKFVEISERDNDDLHIRSHSLLLGTPFATEALQQHVALHQQRLQARLQQQQLSQPQGGGAAPTAIPQAVPERDLQ